MIAFIESLQNAESVEYEINLGFTLNQYRAGYKKFFWDITYIQKKVVFLWNEEQIQLFKIWFDEQLKGGVEQFEADFDKIGIKTYDFLDIFTYSNNEADLYNVQLDLIQKENFSELLCIKGNACLNLLISNLNGQNNMLEANIECSQEKIQANLCLTNLLSLVINDVNNYIQKKILI